MKSAFRARAFKSLAALFVFLMLAAVVNAQSGSVSIRVRNNDSPEAIGQAEVTLVLQGRLESSLSGYTDSSGRVTLTEVRSGAYDIVVKKDGYETSHERVFISGSTRENFFVQLKRKADTVAASRTGTISARLAGVPAHARKMYDDGVAALKEDPSRSIELFQQAIKEHPQFPDAYMMKGYAHLLKGEKVEGIAALSEAVRLDPKFGAAYLLLGKAYLDERKVIEAEQPLRDSVGYDPQSWEAHFQLARCLYNSNKTDEAFQHARRALELPGASPLTRLLLVDLYMTRNQTKDALKELEAFTKADPQSPLIPRVKKMIDKLRERVPENGPPQTQTPSQATPMNP
jgi:Tfp pilus assembly protein PilF